MACRGKHTAGNLAEGDVDRIPGRMRLVLRDVEVAHTHREVDRVDVVEGADARHDVRGEKRAGRAQRAHTEAGRRHPDRVTRPL